MSDSVTDFFATGLGGVAGGWAEDQLVGKKKEKEAAAQAEAARQAAAAQADKEAAAKAAEEEEATAKRVGAMQVLYTSPSGILGGASTASRKLLS